MKVLAICFLFTLALASQAAETTMAIITSEFDDNKTEFYLETNEENIIDGIRWVEFTPSRQINRDTSATSDDVINDGVLLFQERGRDIIRLTVENFDVTTGGVVKLSYLYSGISNTWRFIKLNIVKDGEAFYMTDKAGKKVNRMFVKVNRNPVLGIVGVKEIQLSLGLLESTH